MDTVLGDSNIMPMTRLPSSYTIWRKSAKCSSLYLYGVYHLGHLNFMRGTGGVNFPLYF